jgi:hypothetical protein
MISTVRPEVHFLQTNWPDWLKSDLPADYIRRYQPFVDQIRATHASIPISVQTDISSDFPSRTRAWLSSFGRTAGSMGLAGWTAYEYHQGQYMYTEPPVPKAARRRPDGSIEVSFQKRINPASARRNRSFRVTKGGTSVWVSPSAVTVDGNRVVLAPARLPTGAVTVAVSNVQDTPSMWALSGKPSNTVPAGTMIAVPA